MQTAMGFDPGGSSTLFVGGDILNISPYARHCERSVYSLGKRPQHVAKTEGSGFHH
jgi:hypothetical protein